MNLREWFQKPVSTIVQGDAIPYQPELSADILGFDPVVLTVQPQTLYDLSDYPTPYRALYNRPKTVVVSGV